MISTLPNGRQGRLFALGLLIVVIGLMHMTLAAPLLNFYADRALELDTRRALLGKLHAVAAELPALRKRAAEMSTAADRSGSLLQGGTDAIAAAALQGRVEELAGTAGLTIGSIESLPAQVQTPYRRLGLRMVLSGPYEAVTKLLAMLETATPPLIVDNLQLYSFQKRPGAPVTAASSLDATMEIYGFRAAEATGAAKP